MQNNQEHNIEMPSKSLGEKKVVIHTMPKRFVGSRIIAKDHKGVGMVILILGAILMIGALIVLYIFVLRPKQSPIINEVQEEKFFVEPETTNQLIENPVVSEEEPADSGNNPVNETENIIPDIVSESEIKEININDISTGTSEIVAMEENTETSNTAALTKISAPDSDQDGLSDIEEMLLDCNLNNSDSDSDGYTDLDELMKLYNPAGTGKLMVNPNIEKYTNSTYKYSLYYPNTWLKTSVDQDNSILFQAGANQYIQIIVQNNTTGKNLDDWYLEQMGSTEINPSQRMYKAGWSGIKSLDGLIAYLSNSNQNLIYTVSYNTGMENALTYTAIFNMMVESLAVVN